MRARGLVETLRGREGGYWLAKPPAHISYCEVCG
jgi:DNA-binding IscR family transcriptional regulator